MDTKHFTNHSRILPNWKVTYDGWFPLAGTSEFSDQVRRTFQISIYKPDDVGSSSNLIDLRYL